MKNLNSKIINFHLYFYGICFILIGLYDLFNLSFFFLILTGVSLLPPVHTYFREKVFVDDKSKYYKPFIVCLSLFLFWAAIKSSIRTSTNQSTTISTIPDNVTNVESYLSETSNLGPIITRKTISNENGTYSGEMYNGLKQGTGTFTWKDGSVYIGSFYNDKIEGWGTLTYSNKDKYEGNFLAGKRNGYGKYWFSNGDLYLGYWSNDVMSGYSTYEFENGDFYVGNFQDNKFNGQGKYVHDIQEYEGNWVNNEFKGN